jgi:hypothetical protein
MRKTTINLLLFISISFLTFSVSAFSQTPSLTKKESLILEFRRLTGADRVNMSINLSTEDVRESMLALFEKDSELTEAQKMELRREAALGYDRVDKLAKNFLADRDQLNRISEEVIFKLYDSTYTEAELTEAITFYRSPAGKKTASFLPSLSTQAQKGFIELVVPKLQAIVLPVGESETAKLKQRIAEIKSKKPTK